MKRYTFDEIKEFLLKGYDYKYLCGEYTGTSNSVLTCVDNEGYLLYCNIYKMLSKGTKAKRVHPNNPYSIYNINLFLEKNANKEYKCTSTRYSNNQQLLDFVHLKCGRKFSNKWINICRGRYADNLGDNKTGIYCPYCDTQQLESTHALVLKQVWLHEEPDSTVEDRSCINPNTNCSLPTDIVNHRLKIAIEIQSWFHDFENQKEKDCIKQQYWLEHGYEFYAVDQRDYSVLEMIQLFFPYINEIPDYIDFSYSNKFNDVLAQKLLNKHNSVNKVADIMSCKPHLIYDAIANKRLEYPDGYVNECKTQVVQLNMDQQFVAEYESISEAEKTNNVMGISQALQKGRNYCGGFYWLNKKDYDSGTYTIVPTRLKRVI